MGPSRRVQEDIENEYNAPFENREGDLTLR